MSIKFNFLDRRSGTDRRAKTETSTTAKRTDSQAGKTSVNRPQSPSIPVVPQIHITNKRTH